MGSAMMVITLGNDYDATRAASIKARLVRIDGVGFVDFNYINNKLKVNFDPDRVSLSELEAMVMREKKHRTGLFQGRAVEAGP